MGTGKTSLLVKFLLLNPGKSCLFISTRISFSYSIARNIYKTSGI